ncbi:MAG TPA: hypothetical protein VFK13_04940 [Gemmatimonadaceae bacterium]|nr:hypothetical protein [Gemmatimonadaceae bacterium]
MAGTLDRAARYVPRHLVSSAALGRARSVALQLPAALTNWIYLECRLAGSTCPDCGPDSAFDESSRVDLIVRVDERGRSRLTGDADGRALGEPLVSTPIWTRIRSLARAWAGAHAGLQRAIGRLWLEFDIDATTVDSAAPPVPRVFVEFAPELYCSRSVALRTEAIVAAMELLTGERMRPSTARTVRRCVEQLPPGACIPFAGTLQPSAAAATRICVTGLRTSNVAAYLHAIGWSGETDALSTVLGSAAGGALPAAPVGVLNVDAGADVAPRMGVEHLLDRRSQLGGRILEDDLLDALVARGMCTSHKRAALPEWCGWSREIMPHELWSSLVVRRVNHLKITTSGSGRAEAKAYLCLTHAFHGAPRAHADPLHTTEGSIQ